MTIISTKPAALDRDGAAAYVALSVATMEKLIRQKEFPLPRMASARRVIFLVRELDEWLETRPVSDLLPTRNTGESEIQPGDKP